MNTYDDMETDDLSMPLTPEEMDAERRRQKRIFTRNIEIIKEHNKRSLHVILTTVLFDRELPVNVVYKTVVSLISTYTPRYARGEVSYKMVVNSFAVMDEDNRRMFLGLGRDSLNANPGYGLGSSKFQSGVQEGGLFNVSYDESKLFLNLFSVAAVL